MDNLSGNISEAGNCNREKKMTLPNLAKYRDRKQQAVFICSSPKITEETADYLKSKNQVIYGIGYSDEVLQGIREGKWKALWHIACILSGFMQ